MKGRSLSEPMKRALLMIGEVNYGGLNPHTVSALRRRGLIEDRCGALVLSDSGFDRWLVLLGLIDPDDHPMADLARQLGDCAGRRR